MSSEVKDGTTTVSQSDDMTKKERLRKFIFKRRISSFIDIPPIKIGSYELSFEERVQWNTNCSGSTEIELKTNGTLNHTGWILELRLCLKSDDHEVKPETDNLTFKNNSTKSVFHHENIYNRDVVLEVVVTRTKGLRIPRLTDYSQPTKYTNITLLVEDQKFHQSKEFLASQSTVFEKLLFGDFCEKEKAEIVLEDVRSDTFTALLDILHGDEYHPSDFDSFKDVVFLADQYDLQDVLIKIQDIYFRFSDYVPGCKKYQLLELADKFNFSQIAAHIISNWTEDDYPSRKPEEVGRFLRELSNETLTAFVLKRQE